MTAKNLSRLFKFPNPLSGDLDPRDIALRNNSARSLAAHLAEWFKALNAKGSTPKHAKLFSDRAARVVALLMGAELAAIEPGKTTKANIARAETALAKWVESASLSDLTADRVQAALATLKGQGRSLATCNHHRSAIRAFSRWCFNTHRIREDALRGVTGFNAKEDRRHDRRTLALDELRKLIEAAQNGPAFQRMTGPTRALCYRLAVATGLRYAELASLTPESFNFGKAATLTVEAAYTKNGQTATLPIPNDLAKDLAAFLATLAPGAAVFPLPVEKGAKMLRVDLAAAGIAYRDASDQVFDFHSLRCQCATLADAAGVSPRVVQRMMRHSTLELTGRYTRPRAVDIEHAADSLPSLRPDSDRPESSVMAATGTDGQRINDPFSPHLPTGARGNTRDAVETRGTGNLGGLTPDCPKVLPDEGLKAGIGSTGERTRTVDLRIMRRPGNSSSRIGKPWKTSHQITFQVL
jgi:integrase